MNKIVLHGGAAAFPAHSPPTRGAFFLLASAPHSPSPQSFQGPKTSTELNAVCFCKLYVQRRREKAEKRTQGESRASEQSALPDRGRRGRRAGPRPLASPPRALRPAGASRSREVEMLGLTVARNPDKPVFFGEC
jgi:hypothetical protein